MEQTRQFGFGDEVKRRIMIGTYALSAGYYDAYYLKAQQVRTLIRREFDAAFEKYDAIITPVTPTAGLQDRREDGRPARDVPERRLHPAREHRRPARHVGPVRLRRRSEGSSFRVGLQVIAKPFDEATMLRVAHAYEQATDWHTRRPSL